MNRSGPSLLRIVVHAGSWAPLVWLAWAYASDRLTVDPVQAATRYTGDVAITLLVLCLACTPLNTLLGWRAPLTVRRALGLYAFLYAVIHVLILIGVDYDFALAFAWADLAGKPYVYAGAATFLILAALAATSFDSSKRLLRRGWKRLHRLVYLAGVLAVIHYGLAKKGDVFALRGEYVEPLIYAVAVALLLVMRIPAVRTAAVNLRHEIRRIVISARTRLRTARTQRSALRRGP